MYIMGIAISLLASFLSSLGLILQASALISATSGGSSVPHSCPSSSSSSNHATSYPTPPSPSVHASDGFQRSPSTIPDGLIGRASADGSGSVSVGIRRLSTSPNSTQSSSKETASHSYLGHLLCRRCSWRSFKLAWHSSQWYIGFALYIVCQSLGSFFTLPFIPAMLVAPLGSAGLIFNALFSALFLKTRITLWDWSGTVLIMIGGAIVSIFGYLEAGDRLSIEDLISLWSRPIFIIYFSVLASVVVCLLVWAAVLEHRKRAHFSKMTVLTPTSAEATPLLLSQDRPMNPQGPPRTVTPQSPNYASATSPRRRRFSSYGSASGLRPSNDLQIIATAADDHFLIEEDSTYSSTLTNPVRPLNRIPVNNSPAPPLSTIGRSLSAGTSRNAPSPSRIQVGGRGFPGSISSPATPSTPAGVAGHSPGHSVGSAGLLYAVIGGVAASSTLLLAKSGIELVIISIAERENQFRHPLAFVIIALLVLTLFLQLFGLNKAIALTSPLVAVPLFFTHFTVLSITNSIIYLNQLDVLTTGRLTAIGSGVGIIIAGVWTLSLSKS
ncbi:hypothetical protein DFJ73DRAFT_761814 [Zopfochytrium polystomum]|nr:hypothetical protein DFJ73DRAFT_761814 [Zopfochytrium polystomum]